MGMRRQRAGGTGASRRAARSQIRYILLGIPSLVLPEAALAAGTPIDTIEVRGHLPPAPSDRIFSRTTLDRQMVATAPELRIDDILGDVPGFSLFRRTSSLVAHPTTQGATLRGIGPNGAGRTLVLVDGVPQNDPFGGWVYWGRIAPAVVDDIEVVNGGGVGAYANSALSGTIRINTRLADAPPAFFTGSYGGKDTLDTVGGVTIPVAGKGHLFARGGYNRTDGYDVLKAADRGSVDRPVDSRMGWGEGGLEWELAPETTVTLKAAWFDEDRGNGTPLAYNGTDGYDLSASVVSYDSDEGTGWEAHLFYQDRSFKAQFSSVTADRNSEQPALLQHDVPGSSVGGDIVAHLRAGDRLRLQLGGDARTLKGRTGEYFFWSGDDFGRAREAGGEQLLAGLFAEAIWQPVDEVTATFGLRGDYWEMTNAYRIEKDRVTGAPLLDEHFADRHDGVMNARAGIEYRILPPYALHVAFYTGYRVPTINELYRPYRVRNDITEINPALAPERLYGAEIGLVATPLNTVKGSLTFFINRVKNGIANVELTTTPGLYAPLGVFVPENGSLSQRLNLDRTVSKGVEASGSISLSTGWRFEASYLHVESTIGKATVAPSLKGKRLPQVPKDEGTLSLIGAPLSRWHGRIDLKFQGKRSTISATAAVSPIMRRSGPISAST
jgi:outer membrane receptor protein involved in Fe transport